MVHAVYLGELTQDNADDMADHIYDAIKIMNMSVLVINCMAVGKEYNQAVKDAALFLVEDNEDAPIWVQCLANGNLDMAEDVLKEAKIHFDIWEKEVNGEDDSG